MSGTRQKSAHFLEAVERYLDAEGLLPPAVGVVVGVSGGADSVALLAALRELSSRPERNGRLTVAHLHHGLRTSADADAKFVQELADRWHLPCVIAHQDVAVEARRCGRGMEETGRQMRYAFLRQAAEQVGAAYVAVGHHADDNIETVLYRIIRGTHLRGLAGIPAARPLGDSNIRLIRPLLACTRDEIENFCTAQGLSWCRDETNADVGFRRNFIRHELLPLLRARLNPRADEALERLAAAAAEVEQYLTQQAKDVLRQSICYADRITMKLDAAMLATQPPILRKVAMRLALEDLGLPLRTMATERFDALCALVEPDGPRAVSLPGAFIARRHGRVVVLAGNVPPSDVRAESVELSCPGEVDLQDGRKVLCRIEPFDPKAFATHCQKHTEGREILDADVIHGPLICRPRKAGDVFRPLGCSGRQSVSDFLTNSKLDADARKDVRCICDSLGMVYLAPLRIDDRVKVTPHTKRQLRIEIG